MANMVIFGASRGLGAAFSLKVPSSGDSCGWFLAAGLRGAAHALRESLRDDGVAVTCLNPGNIGTIKVEDGVVSSVPHEDHQMIPPADLVELVKCVTRLSNASCGKEIDVMAITDRV